jgi:predicted nucleotide-binding protein
MSLPIRTTLEDIDAICSYLATKPTGATVAEAKAVVNTKHVDARKLAAMKFWGLIEGSDGGKLKVTADGRAWTKKNGEDRPAILRGIIQRITPYRVIIERVKQGGETSITSIDVAAHWHEHFTQEVSDNDKIINDQAVCFFRLAMGAGLGKLVMGRKGSPTRLDVSNAPMDLSSPAPETPATIDEPTEPDVVMKDSEGDLCADPGPSVQTDTEALFEQNRRVFITHGKNTSFVEPIKKILEFGHMEPIVSVEKQSVSKPVPDKVMDDMRSCSAAIIHVEDERRLLDPKGKEHVVINPNVVMEIGAAMALYGRRFILLVKDGIVLPSNLQGLYEVRYDGDVLDGNATMRLLGAIDDIKNHPSPTRDVNTGTDGSQL